MNLDKYKNKGMVGLENLGNTCFLNACIQVLNNTYELNHILDTNLNENHPVKNIPDNIILQEWNDLRQIMWSGNGIVTPRKFVHNVCEIAKKKGHELFTGHAQNDMTEFLLFFVECLHSSISRHVNINISGEPKNAVDKIAIKCYEMLKNIYLNEYSEIMHMFYGIYISVIESIPDKTVRSIKPESFFVLDVPVACNNITFTSLYECMDQFTKPEILDGDNAWLNDNTKQKESVHKQIKFWNFPPVLVIKMNRFSQDGMRRLNHMITFPVDELNLTKYVCGYNASSYIYELYGLCNHIGSVTGGHYTAFVRNVDNVWLHYNDRTVEVVDNPEFMISPAAYCLFYRKKNNRV